MRQQPSWMLPKRSLRRPEPPSQISPSSQSRFDVHDLQGIFLALFLTRRARIVTLADAGPAARGARPDGEAEDEDELHGLLALCGNQPHASPFVGGARRLRVFIIANPNRSIIRRHNHPEQWAS